MDREYEEALRMQRERLLAKEAELADREAALERRAGEAGDEDVARET